MFIVNIGQLLLMSPLSHRSPSPSPTTQQLNQILTPDSELGDSEQNPCVSVAKYCVWGG